MELWQKILIAFFTLDLIGYAIYFLVGFMAGRRRPRFSASMSDPAPPVNPRTSNADLTVFASSPEYEQLLRRIPAADRSQVERGMDPLGNDLEMRLAYLRAELSRRGDN